MWFEPVRLRAQGEMGLGSRCGGFSMQRAFKDTAWMRSKVSGDRSAQGHRSEPLVCSSSGVQGTEGELGSFQVVRFFTELRLDF